MNAHETAHLDALEQCSQCRFYRGKDEPGCNADEADGVYDCKWYQMLWAQDENN